MSIRWGLLGAGGISRNMFAPLVHRIEGGVVQAVAARDPRRAAALEPVTVHQSYQDLVDDPDVDAVYIGLQNDVHVTWAVAALQAGKHVLCEKPLAMSATEVERMAEAAQRADRRCVEASWYRWHPRTQLIEDLARTGEQGRIREVTCRFSTTNDFAGNYRRDPALGGGALYDIGHYALSAALLSFGDAVPETVEATAVLWDTGVDATTDIRLTYAGGGTASVHLSFEEPYENSWRLRTDQTEMAIGLSAFNPRTDAPCELTLGAELREWPALNAYAVMIEQVTQAFTGEKAWVLPLEESLRTARVTDACFTSIRTGQPVALTSA